MCQVYVTSLMRQPTREGIQWKRPNCWVSCTCFQGLTFYGVELRSTSCFATLSKDLGRPIQKNFGDGLTFWQLVRPDIREQNMAENTGAIRKTAALLHLETFQITYQNHQSSQGFSCFFQDHPSMEYLMYICPISGQENYDVLFSLTLDTFKKIGHLNSQPR